MTIMTKKKKIFFLIFLDCIGGLLHQRQSRKPTISYNKWKYWLRTKPRATLEALKLKMVLLKKLRLNINTVKLKLYFIYYFILLLI